MGVFDYTVNAANATANAVKNTFARKPKQPETAPTPPFNTIKPNQTNVTVGHVEALIREWATDLGRNIDEITLTNYLIFVQNCRYHYENDFFVVKYPIKNKREYFNNNNNVDIYIDKSIDPNKPPYYNPTKLGDLLQAAVYRVLQDQPINKFLDDTIKDSLTGMNKGMWKLDKELTVGEIYDFVKHIENGTKLLYKKERSTGGDIVLLRLNLNNIKDQHGIFRPTGNDEQESIFNIIFKRPIAGGLKNTGGKKSRRRKTKRRNRKRSKKGKSKRRSSRR